LRLEAQKVMEERERERLKGVDVKEKGKGRLNKVYECFLKLFVFPID
jgi:hypothetical protein